MFEKRHLITKKMSEFKRQKRLSFKSITIIILMVLSVNAVFGVSALALRPPAYRLSRHSQAAVLGFFNSKDSGRIQRLSRHIFHTYLQGDIIAFNNICQKNRLDPAELHRCIEDETRRCVLDAIDNFKPDISITHTAETKVEIDMAKGIVRKTPKGRYPTMLIRDISQDAEANESLNTLANILLESRKKGFSVVLKPEFKNKVNRFFDMLIKLTSFYDNNMPEEEKEQLVLHIVEDYIRGMEVSRSYLEAQRRLGGLIANFAIVDLNIYQVLTTDVPQYLIELAGSTRHFKGNENVYVEYKKRIARDILKNVLDCVIEVARRGVFIIDCRFTNFGVRKNRDVVLFDLGPYTFYGGEMDEKLDSQLLSMLLSTSMLDNLYILLKIERREWTDIWIELAVRGVERDSGSTKWQEQEKGYNKFINTIRTVFPKTQEEADERARKAVFIPTQEAKEKILDFIMQKLYDMQRGPEPHQNLSIRCDVTAIPIAQRILFLARIDCAA